MRIELMEGDGFLYEDGKARNVIVVIDGKLQFPFSATASIQDLYEAVKKMPLNLPSRSLEPLNLKPGAVDIPAEVFKSSPGIAPGKANEIERLDIVRYVGKPDEEGDLIPGELYLVQDIIKENGQLMGYAILNEKIPTPIRLTVAFMDVILIAKHGPPPVKINVFEMMYMCPAPCGKEFALTLKDDKYVGTCPYCHTPTVQDRPTVAAETVSALQ